LRQRLALVDLVLAGDRRDGGRRMHHPAAGRERRDVGDRSSENPRLAFQLQLSAPGGQPLGLALPGLFGKLLLQSAERRKVAEGGRTLLGRRLPFRGMPSLCHGWCCPRRRAGGAAYASRVSR
jgi:hypothetical protein